MKIAVVADVHVGNFPKFGGEERGGINERCRMVLAALAEAVRIANERDCTLVVAGDLYEEKRPPPAVVAAVQNVLHLADETPLVVLGNHDAIGPGDHAMAPLWPVANVVANEWAYHDGVLFVPWSPQPALEMLDAALEASKSEGPVRTVVCHFGIYDQGFPPWLKGGGAAAVTDLRTRMVEHGVRILLAGDYHEHREWKGRQTRVVQVGCLSPTGFNNPGHERYGSVLIVDTDASPGKAIERVEVAGPRFLQFRDGEVDFALVEELKAAGHTPFVRVQCAPGHEEQAEQGSGKVLDKGEVDFDVVPDQIDTESPAEVDATASTDEAVAGYIAAMELPPGVEADEVLECVRRYL